MTIFLALACALTWGFSEIYYKKAAEKYKTINLLIFRYTGQVIAYLIFILIFDIKAFTIFNIKIYAYLLPLLLFSILSSTVYNYCLREGKLSIISPILASDPVFVILIGVIFFKEAQTTIDLIALAIICISICVLNFSKSFDKEKAKKMAIFLASIYALIMALSTTLEKTIYLNGYTVGNLFFHYAILMGTAVLVLILISKITKRKIKKIDTNAFKAITATQLGNLLYSYLLSVAYVSLVVPITGLYTVVTQILAKKVLKEKLSVTQRIFVSLIIASTLILLIF